MIKKAAKWAAWIAVGTTVGGCFLPRIIFQDGYSATRPPVWKEGLLFFVTGFIAAFSVLVLIGRIKAERNKGKQPPHRAGMPGVIGERALFASVLPEHIDWDEVNTFLRTTQFYRQVLSNDWRTSDAFAVCPVSDTSIACLGCLHEDLWSCYRGTFVLDENGQEDRWGEYRFLRAHLETKYGQIDADALERIYLQYLQDDR